MMQVTSSVEDQDGGTVVKRLSVPVGLEELMTGLTKEVLQKKPRDIYNFASEHFAQLLVLRDNGNYQQAPSKSITYASKQNRENLVSTRKLPSTRSLSGTPSKLSRQVSIRAPSPTRKAGSKIKRSPTPKHSDGNNNEEKVKEKQERKKPIMQRRQTPGSKNRFDSLEPVKENALKMATKKQSLCRRSTDRRSKDSDTSKDSRRSSSEESEKKKKTPSCDTPLKRKSMDKKSQSGDSKEAKDKKNDGKNTDAKKKETRRKSVEEDSTGKDKKASSANNAEIAHKTATLGLQHSGEIHDILVPKESSESREENQKVSDDKNEKKVTPADAEKISSVVEEKGNKEDIKKEQPDKFIPKSSSIEESVTDVKDGRLTVTPPKILKHVQSSDNFDTATSLVVPVLAAATSLGVEKSSQEQPTDDGKKEGVKIPDKDGNITREYLKEDSETGEVIDSPKKEIEDDAAKEYDPSVLRQELQKAEEDAKLNNFTSSYNPYKLKQEIKNASKDSEEIEAPKDDELQSPAGSEATKKESEVPEENTPMEKKPKSAVQKQEDENHTKEDDITATSTNSADASLELQASEQQKNSKPHLLHEQNVVPEKAPGSAKRNSQGIKEKDGAVGDDASEKSLTPTNAETSVSSGTSGLQHSGELHDQVIPSESPEENSTEGKSSSELQKAVEDKKSQDSFSAGLQHSGELHDSLIPKETSIEDKIADVQETTADKKLEHVSKLQHSGELHDTVIPKGTIAEEENKKIEATESGKDEASPFELQHSGELHDTVIPKETIAEEKNKKIEATESGKDEASPSEVQHSGELHDTILPEETKECLEETENRKELKADANAVQKPNEEIQGAVEKAQKESDKNVTDATPKSGIDETTAQAATKIQAGVRGYLTRKQYKDKTVSKETSLDTETETAPVREPNDKIQDKLSDEELQEALTQLNTVKVPTESPHSSRHKREATTPIDLTEDSAVTKFDTEEGVKDAASSPREVQTAIAQDNLLGSKTMHGLEMRKSAILSPSKSLSVTDSAISRTSDDEEEKFRDSVEYTESLEHTEDLGIGSEKSATLHAEAPAKIEEEPKEENSQIASKVSLVHTTELHDTVIPKEKTDKEKLETEDDTKEKTSEQKIEANLEKLQNDNDLKKETDEKKIEVDSRNSEETNDLEVKTDKRKDDVLTVGKSTKETENPIEVEMITRESTPNIQEESMSLKELPPLASAPGFDHSGELHDLMIPKETKKNLQNLQEDKNKEELELQHSGELHDTLISKEIEETTQDLQNGKKLDTQELKHSGELHDLLIPKETSPQLQDDKNSRKDNLEHSGELHDLLIPKEIEANHLEQKVDERLNTQKQPENVSQELKKEEVSEIDNLQRSGGLHDLPKKSETEQTKVLDSKSLHHTQEVLEEPLQKSQDTEPAEDVLKHSGELHDLVIPKETKEALQQEADKKQLKKQDLQHSGELHDLLIPKESEIEQTELLDSKSIHPAPAVLEETSQKSLDAEPVKYALKHSGELHDLIVPKETNEAFQQQADQKEPEKQELQHSGELHDLVIPKENKTEQVEHLDSKSSHPTQEVFKEISQKSPETEPAKDALKHSGELHDLVIPKETKEALQQEADQKELEKQDLQHSGELHGLLVPKENKTEQVELLDSKSIHPTQEDLEETFQKSPDTEPAKDALKHSGESHDLAIPQKTKEALQQEADQKESEKENLQHSGELYDLLIPKESQDNENLTNDKLQHSGEDLLIPKESEETFKAENQSLMKDASKTYQDLQQDVKLAIDNLQRSDLAVPKEAEEVHREAKQVKDLKTEAVKLGEETSDEASEKIQEDKHLTKDALQHSGELHDILLPKKTGKSSPEVEDDQKLGLQQTKQPGSVITFETSQGKDIESTNLQHTGELHDLLIPQEIKEHSQELKNGENAELAEKLEPYEKSKGDTITGDLQHTGELHDLLVPEESEKQTVVEGEKTGTLSDTKPLLNDHQENSKESLTTEQKQEKQVHQPGEDMERENGSPDSKKQAVGLALINGLQHSGELHDLLIPKNEVHSKTEDEKAKSEVVEEIIPSSARVLSATLNNELSKHDSSAELQHSGEMHDLPLPHKDLDKTSSKLEEKEEEIPVDKLEAAKEEAVGNDQSAQEKHAVEATITAENTASKIEELDPQESTGLRHTGELHDVLSPKQAKTDSQEEGTKDGSKPPAPDQVQTVEVAKVEYSEGENSLSQPCTPSVLADSPKTEERNTSATPSLDLQHDITTTELQKAKSKPSSPEDTQHLEKPKPLDDHLTQISEQELCLNTPTVEESEPVEQKPINTPEPTALEHIDKTVTEKLGNFLPKQSNDQKLNESKPKDQESEATEVEEGQVSSIEDQKTSPETAKIFFDISQLHTELEEAEKQATENDVLQNAAAEVHEKPVDVKTEILNKSEKDLDKDQEDEKFEDTKDTREPFIYSDNDLKEIEAQVVQENELNNASEPEEDKKLTQHQTIATDVNEKLAKIKTEDSSDLEKNISKESKKLKDDQKENEAKDKEENTQKTMEDDSSEKNLVTKSEKQMETQQTENKETVKTAAEEKTQNSINNSEVATEKQESEKIETKKQIKEVDEVTVVENTTQGSKSQRESPVETDDHPSKAFDISKLQAEVQDAGKQKSQDEVIEDKVSKTDDSVNENITKVSHVTVENQAQLIDNLQDNKAFEDGGNYKTTFDVSKLRSELEEAGKELPEKGNKQSIAEGDKKSPEDLKKEIVEDNVESVVDDSSLLGKENKEAEKIHEEKIRTAAENIQEIKKTSLQDTDAASKTFDISKLRSEIKETGKQLPEKAGKHVSEEAGKNSAQQSEKEETGKDDEKDEADQQQSAEKDEKSKSAENEQKEKTEITDHAVTDEEKNTENGRSKSASGKSKLSSEAKLETFDISKLHLELEQAAKNEGKSKASDEKFLEVDNKIEEKDVKSNKEITAEQKKVPALNEDEKITAVKEIDSNTEEKPVKDQPKHIQNTVNILEINSWDSGKTDKNDEDVNKKQSKPSKDENEKKMKITDYAVLENEEKPEDKEEVAEDQPKFFDISKLHSELEEVGKFTAESTDEAITDSQGANFKTTNQIMKEEEKENLLPQTKAKVYTPEIVHSEEQNNREKEDGGKEKCTTEENQVIRTLIPDSSMLAFSIASTLLQSAGQNYENSLTDDSSLSVYESAPTRPVTSDITPNIISSENIQIPADNLQKHVQNLKQSEVEKISKPEVQNNALAGEKLNESNIVKKEIEKIEATPKLDDKHQQKEADIKESKEKHDTEADIEKPTSKREAEKIESAPKSADKDKQEEELETKSNKQNDVDTHVKTSTIKKTAAESILRKEAENTESSPKLNDKDTRDEEPEIKESKEEQDNVEEPTIQKESEKIESSPKLEDKDKQEEDPEIKGSKGKQNKDTGGEEPTSRKEAENVESTPQSEDKDKQEEEEEPDMKGSKEKRDKDTDVEEPILKKEAEKIESALKLDDNDKQEEDKPDIQESKEKQDKQTDVEEPSIKKEAEKIESTPKLDDKDKQEEDMPDIQESKEKQDKETDVEEPIVKKEAEKIESAPKLDDKDKEEQDMPDIQESKEKQDKETDVEEPSIKKEAEKIESTPKLDDKDKQEEDKPDIKESKEKLNKETDAEEPIIKKKAEKIESTSKLDDKDKQEEDMPDIQESKEKQDKETDVEKPVIKNEAEKIESASKLDDKYKQEVDKPDIQESKEKQDKETDVEEPIIKKEAEKIESAPKLDDNDKEEKYMPDIQKSTEKQDKETEVEKPIIKKEDEKIESKLKLDDKDKQEEDMPDIQESTEKQDKETDVEEPIIKNEGKKIESKLKLEDKGKQGEEPDIKESKKKQDKDTDVEEPIIRKEAEKIESSQELNDKDKQQEEELDISENNEKQDKDTDAEELVIKKNVGKIERPPKLGDKDKQEKVEPDIKKNKEVQRKETDVEESITKDNAENIESAPKFADSDKQTDESDITESKEKQNKDTDIKEPFIKKEVEKIESELKLDDKDKQQKEELDIKKSKEKQDKETDVEEPVMKKVTENIESTPRLIDKDKQKEESEIKESKEKQNKDTDIKESVIKNEAEKIESEQKLDDKDKQEKEELDIRESKEKQDKEADVGEPVIKEDTENIKSEPRLADKDKHAEESKIKESKEKQDKDADIEEPIIKNEAEKIESKPKLDNKDKQEKEELDIKESKEKQDKETDEKPVIKDIENIESAPRLADKDKQAEESEIKESKEKRDKSTDVQEPIIKKEAENIESSPVLNGENKQEEEEPDIKENKEKQEKDTDVGEPIIKKEIEKIKTEPKVDDKGKQQEEELDIKESKVEQDKEAEVREPIIKKNVEKIESALNLANNGKQAEEPDVKENKEKQYKNTDVEKPIIEKEAKKIGSEPDIKESKEKQEKHTDVEEPTTKKQAVKIESELKLDDKDKQEKEESDIKETKEKQDKDTDVKKLIIKKDAEKIESAPKLGDKNVQEVQSKIKDNQENVEKLESSEKIPTEVVSAKEIRATGTEQPITSDKTGNKMKLEEEAERPVSITSTISTDSGATVIALSPRDLDDNKENSLKTFLWNLSEKSGDTKGDTQTGDNILKTETVNKEEQARDKKDTYEKEKSVEEEEREQKPEHENKSENVKDETAKIFDISKLRAEIEEVNKENKNLQDDEKEPNAHDDDISTHNVPSLTTEKKFANEKLKQENYLENESTLEDEAITTQHSAAKTIQSNYRGYRVRRDLSRQSSSSPQEQKVASYAGKEEIRNANITDVDKHVKNTLLQHVDEDSSDPYLVSTEKASSNTTNVSSEKDLVPSFLDHPDLKDQTFEDNENEEDAKTKRSIFAHHEPIASFNLSSEEPSSLLDAKELEMVEDKNRNEDLKIKTASGKKSGSKDSAIAQENKEEATLTYQSPKNRTLINVAEKQEKENLSLEKTKIDDLLSENKDKDKEESKALDSREVKEESVSSQPFVNATAPPLHLIEDKDDISLARHSKDDDSDSELLKQLLLEEASVSDPYKHATAPPVTLIDDTKQSDWVENHNSKIEEKFQGSSKETEVTESIKKEPVTVKPSEEKASQSLKSESQAFEQDLSKHLQSPEKKSTETLSDNKETETASTISEKDFQHFVKKTATSPEPFPVIIPLKKEASASKENQRTDSPKNDKNKQDIFNVSKLPEQTKENLNTETEIKHTTLDKETLLTTAPTKTITLDKLLAPEQIQKSISSKDHKTLQELPESPKSLKRTDTEDVKETQQYRSVVPENLALADTATKDAVVSPRSHASYEGAVPRALSVILDQQLAITTPRAEEKEERAKSESPEYIYIPLKDPEETSIESPEPSELSTSTKPSTSKPEHTGELHAAVLVPPLNLSQDEELKTHENSHLETKTQKEDSKIEDTTPSTPVTEDISSSKYDLVEGGISPRVQKDEEGTVPKALGAVADQQLAITTPHVQAKQVDVKSESPEYIYIPLKGPADSSSSSLQHSGEFHDIIPTSLLTNTLKEENLATPATQTNLNLDAKKHTELDHKEKAENLKEGDILTLDTNKSADTHHEQKVKSTEEKDIDYSKYDLVEGDISPRVRKEQEGTVPKALGVVADQQLAITAPSGKLKKEEKCTEDPQYIYIPLKDPNAPSTSQESVDENFSKSSISDKKKPENELRVKSTDKSVEKENAVSPTLEKKHREGLQNLDLHVLPTLQKLEDSSKSSSSKEKQSDNLLDKDLHKPLLSQAEEIKDELEKKEAGAGGLVLNKTAERFSSSDGKHADQKDLTKFSSSPNLLDNKEEESKLSVSTTQAQTTPKIFLEQPSPELARSSAGSAASTPTVDLRLHFSPSPTQNFGKQSGKASPNSEATTFSPKGSHAEPSAREDRSVQSESPPVVVQSAQISDSTMPLAVQLNQPPAGAPALTSPTSQHDGGGVPPTAQAPPKGASAKVGAPKNSAHSRTSMEAGKRRNASIVERNMEEVAATKIQASFRGYQVRKQLKCKNGGVESVRRSLRRKSSGKLRGSEKAQKSPKTSSKPSDLEEKSATKIQAGIRGFLVRRRQQKQNKNNTTPESS